MAIRRKHKELCSCILLLLFMGIALADDSAWRDDNSKRTEPMYETDAMKPFPILRPVPERLADFQFQQTQTNKPKE